MKTPKPYPSSEGWIRATLTLNRPLTEDQVKIFVTNDQVQDYEFGPTELSPKRAKLIYRRKPDIGPPDPRPVPLG